VTAPKYSINILTIDRSRRGRSNYLPTTMRSLVASGLFDRSDFRLTLWEGAPAKGDYLEEALREVPPAARSRIIVDRSPEPTHLIEHTARVLREAARSGSEYVLMLEDDILVVHDWLGCIDDWIERFFADADYPVATFFAAFDVVLRIWVATQGRVGWWRYPADHFWGTLCFALRPATALELADVVESRQHVGFPDIVMNKHFGPDGYFLASVPNFVQHIGLESAALDDPGVRETPCFPGEDWTWVREPRSTGDTHRP